MLFLFLAFWWLKWITQNANQPGFTWKFFYYCFLQRFKKKTIAVFALFFFVQLQFNCWWGKFSGHYCCFAFNLIWIVINDNKPFFNCKCQQIDERLLEHWIYPWTVKMYVFVKELILREMTDFKQENNKLIDRNANILLSSFAQYVLIVLELKKKKII